MASLVDVRDLLAFQGRMEAQRIGKILALPLPRVAAMLEQLERMGKAQRVQAEPDACLSSGCKGCPESQGCQRELWMLTH
ncbi:[Fe-S]-dependent transcriptional repressor FeoC [Franconibacter sp. IITDAS19]|uniref:[Fe-S]-dependent transcriptional repressor FeoC n=1 Tax=Franconibacter sp. IITDAS19 TaxID=2930569 RepID=UPI001FF871F7|nr:[Fe-S]-dependent transcriptional repressor FeoC [Franconibacter sp. IITDAS19]MCK1969835.1 [Fe-S]-dependent transcriptional repressor FeoC [Franconibacter sp. IITDAS19]